MILTNRYSLDLAALLEVLVELSLVCAVVYILDEDAAFVGVIPRCTLTVLTGIFVIVGTDDFAFLFLACSAKKQSHENWRMTYFLRAPAPASSALRAAWRAPLR